jgi:threonine dehydratase
VTPDPGAPPPLERSDLERALVRETPLITGPRGSRLAGLHLKLENLQRTGSFKLRGAARKLARLAAAGHGSVVAASAGNHGAGVALAASQCGMVATVIVPERTPHIKQARIANLGARIIVRGESYDHAEEHAKNLAHETGAVFVSPFDDDDIIDGNGGTLADELLAQTAGDLALVVCPVGGGGLISGLGRRLTPRGVRVIGVQPAQNCAMHESLERGHALTHYQGRPTLAEGCEGAVAEHTYQLVTQHVERIVLVSEDAIARAVAVAYRELGTIIECSAAVSLAGFLENELEPASHGSTACILTGGNIDPDALDRFLRP